MSEPKKLKVILCIFHIKRAPGFREPVAIGVLTF